MTGHGGSGGKGDPGKFRGRGRGKERQKEGEIETEREREREMGEGERERLMKKRPTRISLWKVASYKAAPVTRKTPSPGQFAPRSRNCSDQCPTPPRLSGLSASA